jgi:hypothetical protein
MELMLVNSRRRFETSAGAPRPPGRKRFDFRSPLPFWQRIYAGVTLVIAGLLGAVFLCPSFALGVGIAGGIVAFLIGFTLEKV